MNQTDNAKLHEIATVLCCHRGLIVETIVEMQRDLRHALEKVKRAQEALK
jgi:hypothetical protein